MSFDYSKLLGRVTEKYGTQYNFAHAMKLSERSLSLKLNNKVRWKDTEIQKAVSLLGVPENEIAAYFFKQKVQIFELDKEVS